MNIKRLRIAYLFLMLPVIGYTQATATYTKVRISDTLMLNGKALSSVIYTISAAAKNNQSPTGKAVYDFVTGLAFGGDVTGTYNNLQLGASVVGTAELAANAVDSTKIGPDAVGPSELQSTGVGAGSCTSCDLTIDADGRVTAKANGSGGGGSVGDLETVTDNGNTTSNKVYITGTGTLSVSTSDTSGYINLKRATESTKPGIVLDYGDATTNGFNALALRPTGQTGGTVSDFDIWATNFAGANLPFMTAPDHVVRMGLNVGAGGARKISTLPNLFIAMEHRFHNTLLSGQHRSTFEFHLESQDTLGVNHRFMTAQGASDGVSGDVGFNSDGVYFSRYNNSAHDWLQADRFQKSFAFRDSMGIFFDKNGRSAGGIYQQNAAGSGYLDLMYADGSNRIVNGGTGVTSVYMPSGKLDIAGTGQIYNTSGNALTLGVPSTAPVTVTINGSSNNVLFLKSATGGSNSWNTYINSDNLVWARPDGNGIIQAYTNAPSTVWANNKIGIGSNLQSRLSITQISDGAQGGISLINTSGVQYYLQTNSGGDFSFRNDATGAEKFALSQAGALKLNTYTATSSYPITAVGALGFDASGNIGTIATGPGSGSYWTLTGSDIYRNSKVRVGSTSAPTKPLDVTGDIQGSADIYLGSNFKVFDNGTRVWHRNSSAANLFVGESVGNTTNTGNRNFAFGTNIMLSLTNGEQNVCVGGTALYAVTSGSANTCIGINNLQKLTTGNSNVSIGGSAGQNLVSGSSNMFIGGSAGNGFTTGSRNVAVGTNAANTATTQSDNTGVGFQALKGNSASGSTAIGSDAGGDGSNRVDGVYIGRSAGNAATAATQIALGADAAVSSTATNSIFLGLAAGYLNTVNSALSIDWNSGYAANHTPLISGLFSSKFVGINTAHSSLAAALHITGNGTTSSTYSIISTNSSGNTSTATLAVRDDGKIGVNKNNPSEAVDIAGQVRADAVDIRDWTTTENTNNGEVHYKEAGGTNSAYLSVGAGERRFPIMAKAYTFQAVDFDVAWTTGRTKAFWTVPAKFNGWKLYDVILTVSTIGTGTNTILIEKGGATQSTQSITSSDHQIVLDATLATGDIWTFNISAVSGTPTKGLVVELELRTN
jgi:hypothetical protein